MDARKNGAKSRCILELGQNQGKVKVSPQKPNRETVFKMYDAATEELMRSYYESLNKKGLRPTGQRCFISAAEPSERPNQSSDFILSYRES